MSDKNAPTASSLRAALDAGRGRDKVRFPDPAASPLGTDDEAAGTPPTIEQLEIAARTEIGDNPHVPREEALPADEAIAKRQRTPGLRGLLIGGAMVLLALAGVVLIMT